tara:strand:+ start:361 stop:1203 length:843 start_codon:yes stop_codon:yes gene_type:complete
MATITDADPTAFNAGATPTAGQANAKVNLFDETAGSLDMANLVTGFKFQPHHIQRGTFTRNRASGATANVDFIGDLLWPRFVASSFIFQIYSYNITDSSVEYGLNQVPYIAIPGLSEVMENPYPTASRVRITWRVSYFMGTNNKATTNLAVLGEKRWNNAGDNVVTDPIHSVGGAPSGVLRLFVNGVAHPHLFKRFRGAMSTGVPSSDYLNSETQNASGVSDFQVWEFSAVIDAAEVAEWGLASDKDPLQYGQHTVSIRCFHTNRVVRFKTRYIDWTYVK